MTKANKEFGNTIQLSLRRFSVAPKLQSLRPACYILAALCNKGMQYAGILKCDSGHQVCLYFKCQFDDTVLHSSINITVIVIIIL